MKEETKDHPMNEMILSKEEAVNFFAALFYGEHHIPGEVKECGYGWKVSSDYIQLSTFDYNGLTRLVLLAHDRGIRADVSARGMNRLIIKIHKRTREGDLTTRHPFIEDHIKLIRESRYYNCGLTKEEA
jgi:hypothetical protein